MTASAIKWLAPGSFYSDPPVDAHFAVTDQSPVTVIITGFGPTDAHYVVARGKKQH